MNEINKSTTNNNQWKKTTTIPCDNNPVNHSTVNKTSEKAEEIPTLNQTGEVKLNQKLQNVGRSPTCEDVATLYIGHYFFNPKTGYTVPPTGQVQSFQYQHNKNTSF